MSGCWFRPVVAARVTAVLRGLSGWELLVSVWCFNWVIFSFSLRPGHFFFLFVLFFFFVPTIHLAIVSWRNLMVSACAPAACMCPFRVRLLWLPSWMDDAIPLSSLYQAAECLRVCLFERETQRGGCRWMKLSLDVCPAGWVVARQRQCVCFIFRENRCWWT